MVNNAKQSAPPKVPTETLRASVSFPRDLYDIIERIAKEKKVSVAWIVRDAAEKYVSSNGPSSPTTTKRKVHDGNHT